MRTMFQAAILVPAILAAAPAVAQVGAPGAGYRGPGRVSVNPQRPNIPQPRMQQGGRPHIQQGNRWGGNINGRWSGGMRAPGGWSNYRRPSRGYQLDRYWMSSNFQIPDYYSYGLGAPANGYFWVRYYDDAVMVDSYGRVRDSVSDVQWGGASASASASGGYAAASAAGGGGGYQGQIGRVEPNDDYYQDDGYAQDEGYAEEPIPYPYTQGGYATPVAGGPPAAQCRDRCRQGGGYGASYGANYGTSYGSQSSQSYSGGQGYSSGYTGGGYYGGGSTTTVTITYPAITTTTVTEEVIETSRSARSTYVSRPRTKLVRRAAGKRLRRTGCGC